MKWSLLIIATLFSLPASGQLYKYLDEKGTLHVVDSPDAIPEKYRASSKSVAKGGSNSGDVNIKLERDGNSLLIPVSFGGGIEALMVLDTGASISMISKSLAARLKPKKVGTSRLRTASNEITADVVSIPQMSVRHFTVKDLPVSVNTLPGNDRAEGLLGVDFLNHFRMKLDTQTGQLHLERR